MLKTSLEYINECFDEIISEPSKVARNLILRSINETVLKDWMAENGIKCEIVKNNNDRLSYNLIIEDIIYGQSRFNICTDVLNCNKDNMRNPRRRSNKHKSLFGGKQVQYKLDEFDIIIYNFLRDPKDPNSWEQLAIPSYDLKNPKDKRFMVKKIPVNLFKTYKDKAIETIKSVIELKKEGRGI